MIKELCENPQKMNDPEFKKTLDEEIATLSQIIWSDREDSPLRINELTQRKNEARDPAPRHLMPALWHSIQVDVMSVRLNEQRIYITENLKTRRDKKLQLDKLERIKMVNVDNKKLNVSIIVHLHLTNFDDEKCHYNLRENYDST